MGQLGAVRGHDTRARLPQLATLPVHVMLGTKDRLIPPRLMSLEQSLEFCREEECLEVTPKNVRIRKVTLDANERAKQRNRAKKA